MSAERVLVGMKYKLLHSYLERRKNMKKLGKKKALRGSQEEFFLSPNLRVSRDLSLSVADVFPGMKKILTRGLRPIHSRAKGLKFQLRSKVLLEKYSFENEKQIVVDIWFPSIKFFSAHSFTNN